MKKRWMAWILCLMMALALIPAAVPHTARADDRYLEINEANFPDANFRSWIIGSLPVSGDAKTGYYMTQAQAESVSEIHCSYKDIASLAGIERFPQLRSLSCDGNNLTTLDVSSNKALSYLHCAGNALTALDLSENTALTEAHFYGNEISSLKLGENSVLTDLSCNYNQLTELDLGGCPALEFLSCESNRLTELDVQANTNLESLFCGQNNLTELNMRSNPMLTILYCEDNRLTELDVSQNLLLDSLTCNDNQLTELDVGSNAALCSLCCNNNRLTKLTLGDLEELYDIECNNNFLTELDLGGCPALELLYCEHNQLRALDVTQNPRLWSLMCAENHLSTLSLDTMNGNDMDYQIVPKGNTRSEDYFGADPHGQTIENETGVATKNSYAYDLKNLVPQELLCNVTIEDETVSFDPETGMVTFETPVESFAYLYDTALLEWNYWEEGPRPHVLMDVTVYLTFGNAVEYTVEWNAEDVALNGSTPYVIANGAAQTPRFAVKAADGSVIDPSQYTYEYRENVNAGTAYVDITFTDPEHGTARGWFKI